jgi:hypothetical protein
MYGATLQESVGGLAVSPSLLCPKGLSAGVGERKSDILIIIASFHQSERRSLALSWDKLQPMHPFISTIF